MRVVHALVCEDPAGADATGCVEAVITVHNNG